MEASTTIQKMLAYNKIFVPNYQRAYSWEIEKDNSKSPKQVETFLNDLIDYKNSQIIKKEESEAPYYFGHFLFEQKGNNEFAIIDGQQRLTTIIVFLSSLFKNLGKLEPLTSENRRTYEDLVKQEFIYRFKTVDYDSQLLIDYVIDGTKTDKNGIETLSGYRIVDAFDYFENHFQDQDAEYLNQLLAIVKSASCTTHTVKKEAEAIQMFIFQNNRG
jgi:uncharacterized protein with ParB-like and HNH nuclease domain